MLTQPRDRAKRKLHSFPIFQSAGKQDRRRSRSIGREAFILGGNGRRVDVTHQERLVAPPCRHMTVGRLVGHQDRIGLSEATQHHRVEPAAYVKDISLDLEFPAPIWKSSRQSPRRALPSTNRTKHEPRTEI